MNNDNGRQRLSLPRARAASGSESRIGSDLKRAGRRLQRLIATRAPKPTPHNANEYWPFHRGSVASQS